MNANGILLKSFAAFGVSLLALNVSASTGPSRIGVVDDYKTTIYCVGTDSRPGVFTIDPTSGQTTKLNTENIQYSFTGAGGTFVSPEKLYGIKSSFGSPLAVIATADGDGTNGPWSHTYYSYDDREGNTLSRDLIATDMTYDFTEETIYAVFRHTDYSYWLATYDGEQCKSTDIAKLTKDINAIAADGEGNLYGISGGEGSLYKIDKATASLTFVGSLGVYNSNANQSAVIDATTGKMYWTTKVGYYDTSHSLMEVDLSTGKATKLHTMEGMFNGLFIPAKKADPASPVAVEDLAATFTGSATDVKVTFTLPSKNAGGTSLSGELNWSLSADGTEVAAGTGQPGATVEKIVSLEAGERQLTLTVTQGSLKSPNAKATVFAGFDNPTNISNLTAVADGSSVKLTWDAPTAIHEGATLNQEALSYTVTRNPGSVEVATGLKVCEFTDQLPDDFAKLYNWTVTVVYEGAEPQSLTTSDIASGKPYTVPYSQNFDEAGTLADVTFAQYSDETGNSYPGPTWEIGEANGNKCAKLASKLYYSHNDFLFSAPLALEKGASYTLKFKVATDAVSPKNWDYSSGSAVQVSVPFKLSVFLTKGMDKQAAETPVEPKLKEDISILCDDAEKVNVFVEQDAITFTVAETGTYNLCFHENTPDYTFNNISLLIDDIELSVEYKTPEAVADLAAATEAPGSRDVKLTFTCPSKDTEGNDLESLSKVELYRGEDLIKTFTEEAIPGTSVEYTDLNAPRGQHEYKAIAYIHENASTPATATAKSGFDKNLEIAECTVPESVAENETASASVTITNNGLAQATGYKVVMFVNGKEAEAKTGEPLAEDAESIVTFSLPWAEYVGQTIKVKFAIEYEGDEAPDNNASEEFTVIFAESGISGITGGDSVAVKAYAGSLHILNAMGQEVNVFASDGRVVTTTVSRVSDLSLSLRPGVYVVTVGAQAYKVTL